MEKYNREKFLELFSETNSFGEFVITFLLKNGREIDDSECAKTLEWILCDVDIMLTLDMYDELILKCAAFIHDMIIDLDMVNDRNKYDICSKICGFILRTRYKDKFMDVFKHLCKKFPDTMKREYSSQSIFATRFTA